MPESANEHLDQLERIIRDRAPSCVLDVGMGRGNYGWFLRNRCGYRGKLIGVEVWAPYVEGQDAIAGGNRTYYDRIVVADIRSSEQLVRETAPDIVFAFDIIEHMSREEGEQVIRMLQRLSNDQLLVSVPIVPYPQGPIYGNPYEEHKHDWTISEVLSLGSECPHRGTVTGLFAFPSGAPSCHVTVMLNTAREDSSTSGRPPLKSLADDLRAQSPSAIKFEMIAVDGLFPWRSDTFVEHDYPFRILHVPPRDTAMVRNRKCAISAYKNTGLTHARGELVLTVDDCALLDSKYIERAWNAWADHHECLSALYSAVASKIKDDTHIDDARKAYLNAEGRCVGPLNGNVAEPSMFGFAAIPIEAALAVNGYDELFDGSQGLEDMDMGVRLQQAGYRLALDLKHQVRLAPQGKWSPRLFDDGDIYVKCPLTTSCIQRQRGIVRANTTTWGAEEWSKITPRCYLLTPDSKCSSNGHPCPYVACNDREHPQLVELQRNQPVFDLRAMRAAAGIR